MGCLDEGHLNVEIESVMSNGVVGLGQEDEANTIAIEDAVKVLLLALGEDVNREGIRKTPHRVAKALHEGTRGYRQKVKEIVEGALFPEAGPDDRVGHAGGAGGLVLVRDLDHFSYCESCLLPFQVKCHVGYISSGQRVVGLSKLSRVTDMFAKRLQEPQRLVDEICFALHEEIKPAGVAVVIQCSHLHFPNIESVLLDSKHQGWVKILVSSGSGVFENKSADLWDDYLNLLKFRGIDRVKIQYGVSSYQCWCPSLSPLSVEASSKIEALNPASITAVTSILKSLGEDPLRKELVGTPGRFVKWLMNFRTCNMEMRLNDFHMNSSNTNGKVNLNEKQICSELNLPFWSQCEHHLLPFHGVVHVGFLSSEGFNPIGKSLLQSIVHFYGFKLQVQERLTRQIAETISPLLGGDVIVVVEAGHTCMISRGIQKFGSSTATIATLGHFSTDSSARSKFLQSIPSFTFFGAL